MKREMFLSHWVSMSSNSWSMALKVVSKSVGDRGGGWFRDNVLPCLLWMLRSVLIVADLGDRVVRGVGLWWVGFPMFLVESAFVS